MKPTPQSRKHQVPERIELPELVGFVGPDGEGLQEQAHESADAEDSARGLEFIIHVENLACFGVQVTGAWIAGFGEEGGTDMP